MIKRLYHGSEKEIKAPIPYIEKEYGIAIMNKTKKHLERQKKPYKRDRFDWRQYDSEYAY